MKMAKLQGFSTIGRSHDQQVAIFRDGICSHPAGARAVPLAARAVPGMAVMKAAATAATRAAAIAMTATGDHWRMPALAAAPASMAATEPSRRCGLGPGAARR